MTILETDINYIELWKTLSISVGVIIFAFFIFYVIWLRNPLFHQVALDINSAVFPENRNFYAFLFEKLLDLKNNEFWIPLIGFEGYFISSFIPSFYPIVDFDMFKI